MSLQSTDPIADLLTRIRNAAAVGKTEVRVPSSKLKKVVAEYPGPKLETRDQFKQTQVNQVNQLLNLIYVLLFFAIVIALFGIANTLGLSIIERTHELGLLRAVGMTRRQLRSSVRWESVIIALLGTILGLVIGVVFAWALVHALSDQGIDQFSLAPVQLAVIVVLTPQLVMMTG